LNEGEGSSPFLERDHSKTHIRNAAKKQVPTTRGRERVLLRVKKPKTLKVEAFSQNNTVAIGAQVDIIKCGLNWVGAV